MKPGEIRIIGGKWRGRKLPVIADDALRPTPDRVRETLFNWLAPYMMGAYCLDLFAGSGALGFEALSRGAKQVVMIDASSQIVDRLQIQREKFDARDAIIYQAVAPRGIRPVTNLFDVVFLDPPYQSDLLVVCSAYLESQGFLAENALIYLEARSEIKDNMLPSNWELIKRKKAGHVYYHLAQRKRK